VLELLADGDITMSRLASLALDDLARAEAIAEALKDVGREMEHDVFDYLTGTSVLTPHACAM
jgi:hypothetical protein